ncbi:MAG: tetratricopeptide repeat protein, partial [Caldilineaceae bacterium]|nr:tetratricopeptide repeat protein [Caldilineaceae bacterium]
EFARLSQYPYGQANAGMNLGAIHGWRGEFDQAETHLHEAIEFFELTGRINKLAEATYNLAFVRRLAGRFHSAIEPAEEALQLFTKVNRQLGCAYAMQILAEVYTALDDLTQAEYFARAVLQEENVNVYPDSLRVLGEIRLKQGNLSEAERLIRESQEIAQKNDDPVLLGYALRSLSEVLSTRDEHQPAVAALTDALQVFRQAEMKAEAQTTQQLLERQLNRQSIE